jgi:hypothetical protein
VLHPLDEITIDRLLAASRLRYACCAIFSQEHDMTKSKSLCIAIGVVFVFSGAAIAQAVRDSSQSPSSATDAKASHAAKQKHKRTSKRRAHETLAKSDERIIDGCRDLRFAEKAACLHEKRGDQYASLWRAIAAGNLDLAIGGTSGSMGTAGAVTMPGESQPVSDTMNAPGR